MVKDEAFIDLEESLVAEILPRWVKIQARIVGQVTKAIENHDLEKVQEILDTINSKSLYRGKTKKINLLLKTGMFFGASRLTGQVLGLKVPSSNKAKAMVNIATSQFKLQLDGITDTMKQRYMRIAINLEQALTIQEDKAKDKKFKSEVHVQKVNPINIGQVLATKGSAIGGNMVKVASSLQMSRVSAYGFAAEATARGATTYKINEQLDSRTCPVCRTMHGKTFNVEDAFRKLDNLIRITDPNDLKLLAPFPKQDRKSVAELKKLSKQQLRERGFDTPPYHPSCRGLLAVSKTKAQYASVPRGKSPKNSIGDTPDNFLANEHYLATDVATSVDAIIEASGSAAKAAIIAFEKRVAKIIPTSKRYRDKDGNWTKERTAVHEKIIKEILDEDTIRRATPDIDTPPSYVVLGGRGGSGKSWLTKGEGAPVKANDYLILDSDAIKGKLDEYQGWNAFEVHKESSYLFDEITKRAAQLRINVVHDMTLKTQSSALLRVEAFKKQGYDIEGYYMYLPRKEAANRAVSRAMGKTQRYVPLDIILANTENEAVFDRLKENFIKWGMWSNDVKMGEAPVLLAKSE